MERDGLKAERLQSAWRISAGPPRFPLAESTHPICFSFAREPRDHLLRRASFRVSIIQTSGRRQADFVVPSTVAVIIWLVGLAVIGPWPVGVFYDDGIYLSLARALAEGHGLRYLNLPENLAGVRYPPLYPALLALIWKIAPDRDATVVAAKFVNMFLLGIGGAGFTVVLMRPFGVRPAVAAIAALAGSLAVPVLATASVLFSEPLFFVTLLGAGALAERVARDHTGPGRAFTAGLICALPALVRTVGIALPAGLFVILVLRGRWRDLACAGLGTLILLTPWMAWTARHAPTIPAILQGNYGSYFAWYAEGARVEGGKLIGQVLVRNLAEIVRPFGVFLSPMPTLWVRVPLLLCAAIVSISGLRRLAQSCPVVAVGLLIYLTTILLWPFEPDRFLWGIWPVIVGVYVLGVGSWWPLGAVTRFLPARWLLTAASAISVFAYLRYGTIGFKNQGWEPAQRSVADAMRPALEWVAKHVPPDRLVAGNNDPMYYLYTGRRAIPSSGWSAADYVRPPSGATAIANLEALLDRFHPEVLLVLAPNEPAAFGAKHLLQTRPARLVMIDSLPHGGAVFRPVYPQPR